MRSIFIALAWLLVAPLASEATILGDQVYLNVTTIDPPDLPVFGGSSILADGPVDFTFADLALDANDVPKYVFDVDFTGPDGLTVVITATRNTALDDINGQFRSFEFSGIHSVGDSMVVTNATLTGVSGTAAVKWQAGATITEVGPDYFTFETGSWNSSGVVQGDTIIATIQLDLQPVVSTGNTYQYDALDRLTRVNYPDGRFVTYSYDRAGNIVARAVPEPGLGSMVMAGILGLASLAGRRRLQGQGNAHVGRSVAVHGVMVAVFAMLVLAVPSPVSAQAGGRPVSGGDWHEAVREQIAEAEYEVSVSRGRLRGASEGLQAPNRAHGFRTHFLDEGVLVTPREQMDESWELGLSFLSYGRGTDARRPGWAAPRADRKRVRYERSDVVEWFFNDRKGLEQGFTLRSAPRRRAGRGVAGDALLGERRDRGAGTAGAAFVALRVDGDAHPMLASDRQSVSFHRPDVPLAIAHYDHLVVVDANGRVLDSWMEVFRDGAGHGIRLVFDDKDAEYPVEIDPLLTTPGWSAEGNQADDGFGFSVSGAGDVNADGYDDVLVGVPWYDGGEQDTGRAYLFFGSPAGLSTVPAWFASGDTPAVGEAGSRLGYSVAAAGDVDNDGFDDILVASVPPFAIVLPGTVYLYRGSPTGPSSVADWSLVGRGQHGLGSSIAGAADFNGDGFDDVVLGESGALAGVVNRGRVYVFYGNATATLGGGASCVATSLASFGAACDGVPLALSAGVVWGEGGSDEQYGARVASAGNLNCDPWDDLILGQPAFDGRDGGRIQIYLGSAAGIDGGLANADYDLAGSAVNGNFVFEFGAALVAAAPLDGNPSSCGALLIGAPGKDRDDVIPQTGGVYVLEGSDPFPTGSTAPQLLAEGTIAWENFGTSLANVGDVNGDGAEDFLVGAPGEFTQQETPGRAYLLLGSAGIGGLNPNPVWRADGAEAKSFLGSAVAGAGDVNNDQLDDLIIGSAFGRIGQSANIEVRPDQHPTDEPGSAFVYYGAVPALFGELLGDAVSDQILGSFAWNGDSATDSELATSTFSPGIAAGSSPGSVILSTGLAQDEATGAYDLNGDGLPDRVAAGVVLSVPAGTTTLRFTTQYLVSDPAEEPRPEARIKYRYAPVDIASPTDFMILETEIERLGDGQVQTPVSHAIDVTGVSQIKLQLQVEEQGPSGTGADSAVVLSKMYFSDVPVPGHLSPEPGSPECATLGTDPTGPEQDRNGDCRVDYVANPRPTDVSASAGPFRYQIQLFDVPGKIIPFQLSLSYDSERTREEQLGPKWSHSYASTLVSTGDVDPVDGCLDTLITYPGGGSVEVFEGEPNPDFPGSSGIVCLYPPRYPGVFSKMDSVPAPLPDGRLLLRYRYKDGFRAGYEQVTLGSNEYRRRSYIHPDANRNLLWNYDDSTGEIESIQDSRGELFYFSYDESFDPPRLTSVNGSGAQVSFGYSALGFLESVTDANGLETTFTYDDDGKLLTITDADGTRLVANEYETFDGLGLGDSGDRIVRQRNALPSDVGRVTTYNRGDELETQDREDGRKLDRYDVFGRLVETRVLLDSTTPNDLADCDATDDWCAVSTFEYNAENLVVRQTDPRGVATELEYDDRGNLICRTADADGVPNRMGMLYDAANNLLAELVQNDPTDLPACPLPDAVVIPEPAKWHATTYTYRPLFNYLLTRTDPDGRTTSYTYDEVDGSPEESLLQQITFQDSTTQSVDYDSLGNISAITDGLGEATTFTTDLMGRPTSVRDPRPETLPGEFTRRTQYDPGGRLTAIFGPPLDPLLGFASSPTELFTYDAQGRGLTRRDEAGHVWTQSYTPTGQLEVETDPLGNATQYAYDRQDRLTLTTDKRGFEMRRAYDAAGRLTSITDPFGGIFRFGYDKAGNLTSETTPQIDPVALSTTNNMYDSQGRLMSTLRPADDDGARAQTLYEYDTRGQLTKRTEEPHPVLGAREWTATYTDSGQLATSVDPEGVSSTYAYDARNRLALETQDQLGRVTGFEYDAAGRLAEVSVTVGLFSLSGARATYDVAGNNETVTDPRNPLNNIVEYDYDAFDRIVRERDGLGNENEIVYEERGLVTTQRLARDYLGTRLELAFGYDAAERLVSTSATDVTGPWTIMETLDASGNATASTVDTDAAVSVQRSFDGLNRQTSRTPVLPTATPQPTTPTVQSEYDAAGNLARLIYSDGKEVLYAYDALSRLISVTDWDANVTTYAYDELGNVDEIVRPDGSTAAYGYDRAGRLLSIVDSNPSLAEPTLFQADFTLDAAGRRVDATLDLPLDPTLEPSASFSYDDANRLVARDGEVFAYDADGNLISGSLGGSSRTLEYNALNQLVAIDGGAEIIRYDADGRRAWRQVGATKTFYVYDTAGRLLEEVDDSGAVTARYVHGLGLISRQDAAQDQAGSGEVSVYHFDSRGSTLALTDSGTGAITDVYAYSPFGGVQRDPMNATPNPFTYNGRDGVVDDDNGLYYMKARYYAPELMRFVQKDPVYDGELALPQSLNRYAFVEGNPIEKIDPTGEFGVFSAVVGAVVGAAVGATTAIIDGKSLEEVLISAAIGAAVGAASSIGLGSAVAASFAGGFLQAGGDISDRLEGGAFDAFGALALGGLGKIGGKALAKSGFGKRLAGSKLASSFSTTALGRKALPITAASRRLFTQAGSGAGRSARRGAVRSVSRRSVAREAITGVFEEGGTSFLEDSVQGVGVFVGKRLAGLARDAQDGYLAQTFRSTPALFERSRYESISFGPVR